MASVECGWPQINPAWLTLHGPTVQVQIKWIANGEGQVSELYPALVDTGAGECCIDSALALELALPIVDRQWIAGATGREIVNIHEAELHVPALGFVMTGRFAGVHLTAGGQQHHALIGRTLLLHHVLVYDGQQGSAILTRK